MYFTSSIKHSIFLTVSTFILFFINFTAAAVIIDPWYTWAVNMRTDAAINYVYWSRSIYKLDVGSIGDEYPSQKGYKKVGLAFHKEDLKATTAIAKDGVILGPSVTFPSNYTYAEAVQLLLQSKSGEVGGSFAGSRYNVPCSVIYFSTTTIRSYSEAKYNSFGGESCTTSSGKLPVQQALCVATSDTITINHGEVMKSDIHGITGNARLDMNCLSSAKVKVYLKSKKSSISLSKNGSAEITINSQPLGAVINLPSGKSSINIEDKLIGEFDIGDLQGSDILILEMV